jgi:hypothetical protein
MSMTVDERVQWIATFRFIEVRLMEVAAAWTPSTPEMEAKVVLGRHIWDFAQHADALGKRTFEMRRAEQFSQRPVDGYVGLLEEVAAVQPTADRLAALYDAVLPGLERRYRLYLGQTDALLDAPSVVTIERILADHPRQRAEVEALRRELGLAVAKSDSYRDREGAFATLVAAREVAA